MSKAADLTGQVFGRLTVVERHFVRKGYYSPTWVCKCSCGENKTIIVTIGNLRNGSVQSCGCLRKEAIKQANTTHGLSYSSEYSIWRNIKARCYNPKATNYSRYGGRGITMCDEWKESFEAFYRDMGSRPSIDHTIDRKNNNKGYCKDNCRWATKEEQMRNRENNLYYELNGERKLLVEWCSELNLNYDTITSRLRIGRTFEEAIKMK